MVAVLALIAACGGDADQGDGATLAPDATSLADGTSVATSDAVATSDDSLVADPDSDGGTAVDDADAPADTADGATATTPDDSATAPDDTSATAPDDTATPPDDSTATAPDDTATAPDDTTAPPDDTTTPPDDATAPPDDTAAPPDDTVVADTAVEPDVVVEPPKDPLITELMAKNDTTLLDGFGQASDWIELYNPHDVAIDLGGYKLSDDPTKSPYVFPPHELAPGAFAVVFASGRTTPAPGELHASFKLDNAGETLVLLAADGRVVQTVAFPRQVADVSYGLSFDTTVVPLVASGATGRYQLIGTSPAPAGWTASGYDDSAWSSGPSGFGWVPVVTLTPGPEPTPGFLADLGPALADSSADWSTNGTQGYRGWSYGYWPRPTNGTYSTDAFKLFPSNYWTGSNWDWPNGNPPWTFIGQTGVHGNGTNNNAEHWPIRRWTSSVDGTLVLAWSLKKTNSGGNGVSGHVFVDGVELDHAAVAGNDTTGFERVLTAEVSEGSLVELAHDPKGPGGQTDDGYDGSAMTLRVWLVPNGDDLVASHLTPVAAGASLLVRHTFDVPDPTALAHVVLGLEVDDGAAAYINGVPVATLDAPSGGEGPAPLDRTALGQAPVPVDIAQALLVPGRNVLAVRAFDSLAADGALAVRATLDSRTVALSPRWSYFTQPTPGTENGAPASALAPLVGDLSDSQVVAAGQPIVVHATIVATVDPIATARLYYRVMFDPEVALDMTAPTTPGSYDWTATIPASAAVAGQLVRWRVVVTDTAARTTKEPPFLDPLESEEYLGTVVTDPSIVSSLPVMHWFVSSPESADTTSGTRGALFYGGELYDNIKFFIHGQSTAGFPKKSYNVDFNDSHRFRMTPGVARMPDVNLLTNWADKTKVRNTLAYAALAAAGVGHHLAFPVRVQQNGAFFSVADLVEDGDGHWLERLGKDPDGALYKMYDALDNVANAEKKTRKYEGKDDLQAVIDALSQNASSRAKWVWDHVDIPGMVGFAAGLVLVSDGDCCHKNYYAYRDTNGTGEWVYLPWDVDLTFGHNWTFQYNYFDETYYYDNALWAGGNSRILKACFEQADFKAMVVRRLRTMMDELFQSTGAPLDTRWMESTIAAIQAQIGDDADLDADAWGLWGTPLPMDEAIDELLAEWFPARRGYLYDTLVTSTHDIPAAQPADATLTIASFDASPAAPTQGYIQLHNASTTLAIDLTDARLTGDVSFTMRPGTVIAPNGDLWLAADVNGFRARASSPKATEKRFVQGAWNGTLGASPTLTLTDRFGHVLATRTP